MSVEASSIPSDPQRRKPDDQTRSDGVVEPPTGDGWPIHGVGGLKRPMYACSSLSGTEELHFADTGEL